MVSLTRVRDAGSKQEEGHESLASRLGRTGGWRWFSVQLPSVGVVSISDGEHRAVP